MNRNIAFHIAFFSYFYVLELCLLCHIPIEGTNANTVLRLCRLQHNQRWPSITPIWSCAGSNQGLPLVGFARSVMVSVWYVTLMCALARLWGFVMNATTDLFRVGVLSVEDSEFLMPTIAKSVHSRRKIGMDVQRSSTWGVRKQIFFTNGRNMVSRRDDEYRYRAWRL